MSLEPVMPNIDDNGNPEKGFNIVCPGCGAVIGKDPKRKLEGVCANCQMQALQNVSRQAFRKRVFQSNRRN